MTKVESALRLPRSLSQLFKKGKVSVTTPPTALELAARIGHTFKNPELLHEALTHRSFSSFSTKTPRPHQKTPQKPAARRYCNERLEFLGDSVLSLVITGELMERFPELEEGNLSKIRATLVSEASLALIARRIDLGSAIFLSRGEDVSGGRERTSNLADALEALIGAVYLDRGIVAAQKVICKIFAERLDRLSLDDEDEDFKTRLQESVQARFKTAPTYEVVSTVGPDHSKVFTVRVTIDHQVLGQGSGPSKKKASQDAARQALASQQFANTSRKSGLENSDRKYGQGKR